ncbi:hypothetical protein AO825_08475 [Pectobacterium brasiliense]|uniref:hypothetical protein n=1 Tax=Pectobacterium brasiliense TaxID=180957 RepID=UPI0001A444C6|nr:hypothetical protein [Pectobacterium brasiliense]KRF62886.1 hypothetical protein AO825_08475 [Pectobacterium brasiliense]MBN3186097.1 hypothetical protein [Pectobacterium brasiliense]QHG26927.1 hypothetical protein GT391_02020 [Pectobacterium brasiliense]
MTDLLSKERLESVANGHPFDGNTPVLSVEEVKLMAGELLQRREAAENPVAWTDAQELRDVERRGCGYLFTVNPITPNADMRRVIPLFKQPPLTSAERERLEKYANERNAENQDLMVTIGKLRVERERLEERLAAYDRAAKEPVGNDKAWHICNNCDDEVSGHRRVDLFVAPDGRWLCENCADGECYDGKLPDNWRKTLPHPPELFTAPPLPVVPDDCPDAIYEMCCQMFDDPNSKATEIWNACRAAMLQSGNKSK